MLLWAGLREGIEMETALWASGTPPGLRPQSTNDLYVLLWEAESSIDVVEGRL